MLMAVKVPYLTDPIELVNIYLQLKLVQKGLLFL